MKKPYSDTKSVEARLHSLADAIAADLSGDIANSWRVRKRDDLSHGFDLLGPDNARLFVSACYPYRGSLEVRGHFAAADAGGRQFWSSNESPKINCSLAKSGAQIAGDIKVKLLPRYRELLAECAKAWDELCDYRADVQQGAQQIAKAIGAAVDYANPDSPSIDAYHSTKLPEFSVDIRLGSNQVTIDRLSLTVAETIKVFELLVRLRSEKK